jgi:FkbM family methyltransferase
MNVTTKLEDIDPYELVKKRVNIHTDTYADQRIVLEHFKNSIGNFLCVGAGNGLDPTRELLKLGWHGVYCEPDPFACTQLIMNTKEFADQITIINSAITPNGGIADFYVSIDNFVFSSLKPDWAEKHTDNSKRIIKINTISFRDLLSYLNINFDYIQTDTEGLDIELIESVNWVHYPSVKVICTEARASVFKQLMQQGKFMITDITNTNAFYIKQNYGNTNDK